MNKYFKSSASLVLLSAFAFASVSATQPKPAHAVVGLATGNGTVLVTGALLGGLGTLAFGASWIALDNRHESILSVFGFGVGFMSGVAGVIVLEGGNMEFGHLDVKQAKAIGLTPGELQSYEDELSEANAVLEDQRLARVAELEKTGTVSIRNSQADWREAGTALSPLTFSAMQKIAAKSLRK
jgi:hypothetical protein